MRWVSGLLLPCLLALACGEVRPNIVLVIADDQGYSDFGFMGSEWVQTPRLDELAAQGTTLPFTYNTASVCRPSLLTLLTGYSLSEWNLRVAEHGRRGIYRPRFTSIQDFDALPRVLSVHGYATFQAGKYWEGTYDLAGFTHGMTAEKSSYDLGQVSGAAGLQLGRETLEPVFEFIDQHVEGPFFVWFAPLLPHLPHDAPERHVAPYRGTGLRSHSQNYYAAIGWFDEIAGQLLDHLEAQGLAESTLVVFLSDNGWESVARGPIWLRAALGGPRGKFSLYELGFRTPMVFRWPGHVEAGRTVDALVSTVDLMPTLLDYAGIEPLPELPGQSLRPLLEGRTQRAGDHIVMRMEKVRGDTHWGERLGDGRGGYAVRTPRWYYVRYDEGGREELYDAVADPRQEHDVAGQHPDVIEQMDAHIRHWHEQLRERSGQRVALEVEAEASALREPRTPAPPAPR